MSGVTIVATAVSAERRTPECLRFGSEPGPLGIGEPQSALAQLFAQDTVLLAQEIDDLRLFAVDEAGEHERIRP